jgi:sulfatase modifying factor 1
LAFKKNPCIHVVEKAKCPISRKDEKGMSKRLALSRREFLKTVGIAASAATLGACTPPTSTKATPTLTAVPSEPAEEITPISPEMILVEAGSFQMGSTDGLPDEQLVHAVHITWPFYIAKYTVTFDEYDKFYYDNPGSGIRKPDDGGLGRGNRPVEVTWSDAVAYCNWLSEKEGLPPCYSGKGKVTRCDFSANGYRLPTEAEWEYAARGGTKTRGYTYAGSDNPDDVAWYADNSGGQIHPVGQKQPNELGLYDMSGNIWEWCWDWYDGSYYASSPASDPKGPALGPNISLRVKRGGRADLGVDSIRITFRSAEGASFPAGGNGFRLVRTE